MGLTRYGTQASSRRTLRSSRFFVKRLRDFTVSRTRFISSGSLPSTDEDEVYAGSTGRGYVATHEVFNQPPPLENHSLWQNDKAMQEAVEREGGAWAKDHLAKFGELTGSERVISLGFEANANPPTFVPFDRFGHRVDRAHFHPSYHELMELGKNWEVPSFAWNNRKKAGSHVARAALPYMLNQVDGGVNCPLTMTFAAIPALEHTPEVAQDWVPKLTSKEYDSRDLPLSDKRGATMGMSMTEKQGGSDVRANTTVAKPADPSRTGPGEGYYLEGHKWFISAPMCDAFLTLAQTPAGISCFLVPRWLPNGEKNKGFQLQRLKNKLGDRSNASSEVEYMGAWGQMIGMEGKGVRTIIDMVTHTRLDCVLGSTSIMRQAVMQASHHVNYRSSFGARLAEMPLMQNVIVDLALEAEAATALAFRLARGFDEARSSPEQKAFTRLATAVAKYWVCKRCPNMVYEAMECLGGNGYVEESILPRLYRQAPLNSIWEGSGNVICLDVLRTLKAEPVAADMFLSELGAAKGIDSLFDNYLSVLQGELFTMAKQLREGVDPGTIQFSARRIVDGLALSLQTSLLLRSAPSAVAAAFVSSRLRTTTDPSADRSLVHGLCFGTLKEHSIHSSDIKAIIERVTPKL